MDITRNQFFLFGLVLLFLGVELLALESVTLTPDFTLFLAKQTNHPIASLNAATETLIPNSGPVVPPRTLNPPDWIGWCLASVGAVLVLHSLSMKKPGG